MNSRLGAAEDSNLGPTAPEVVAIRAFFTVKDGLAGLRVPIEQWYVVLSVDHRHARVHTSAPIPRAMIEYAPGHCAICAACGAAPCVIDS